MLDIDSKFIHRLQKNGIRLTFILCFIIFPLYAWKVSDQQSYTDFDVYYKAADRARQSLWNEIYNLKDGASPFRYAPIWIPFFKPFAAVSLKAAKIIWYILQWVWFGLGFYGIFKTLKEIKKDPLHLSPSSSHSLSISSSVTLITCLSLLYILRFCLDTFTIGQVSSLIFASLSFSLYSWVCSRFRGVALGLVIPTVLKIGPGFLYGIFLNSDRNSKKRVLKTLIITFGLLGSAFLIWTHSLELSQQLWKDWFQIVLNDSNYYDASHYGSQSFKSVLLRMVRWDWLSTSQASFLYFTGLILSCTFTALFWLLRKPNSLLGRGFFFALGIYIYIWFMPETFKYSLTPLAFPVALLFIVAPKDRWTLFSLIFGAFTLSLAGKDIIGDFLFFGFQKISLPALATLFLGISTYKWAWKESSPSDLSLAYLTSRKEITMPLGPWTKLPEQNNKIVASLLVPIPLDPLSTLDLKLLDQFLSESQQMLQKSTQGQFEILLLPYGNEKTELSGRGAALRQGFLNSQGEKILICQIEQPCDIDFFENALKDIDSGYELVRANRRLNESRFKIPVRFLSLVYGRHRLGLIFNFFLKLIFPFQSRDCLSGNLALTRKFAHQVFALHVFPHFLFELELSLIASAQNIKEKDRPVVLSLAGEKSGYRVISEILSLIQGLPRLYFRFKKGFYHRYHTISDGITADDWGMSPGINLGILELARRGIVRRVSIMANCAYLENHLTELMSIPNVELGLHFNLTYGKSSQKLNQFKSHLVQTSSQKSSHDSGNLIHSPGRFLFHWLNPLENNQDKKDHVINELVSQLELLKKRGIKTSYLDGHHHIHLVPGLIECIADKVREYGIYSIRLPYDSTLWFSKKAPLAVLSLRAKRVLRKHGFTSMPCIYPNLMDFQDQGKLRKKLSNHPHSEVIVHPAQKNDVQTLDFPDSYTTGRTLEYRALQMLGLDS